MWITPGYGLVSKCLIIGSVIVFMWQHYSCMHVIFCLRFAKTKDKEMYCSSECVLQGLLTLCLRKDNHGIAFNITWCRCLWFVFAEIHTILLLAFVATKC